MELDKNATILPAMIDIGMPRMNGWEVVKDFKKNRPTSLIMVTGSTGAPSPGMLISIPA